MPPCTGTAITAGSLCAGQYSQSFSYDNMGRKAGPEAGDTYYLTGKFKALDAATEWFHDDGTLYLWAPESDNPAGHTVEAKRRAPIADAQP